MSVNLADFHTLVARVTKLEERVHELGSLIGALQPENNIEELIRLRQDFKQFDSNNDGYITTLEMYKGMQRLGHKLSEKDAADIVKQCDIDGDKKINFGEFLNLMSKSRKGTA